MARNSNVFIPIAVVCVLVILGFTALLTLGATVGLSVFLALGLLLVGVTMWRKRTKTT